MTVLEMEGISKLYGAGPAEVRALRSVHLQVAAGEMVAVMGPSGSGKSSLLMIAGTLEDATAGRVRVAGQDVAAMAPDQRARLRRRGIGYVFQELNLLEGLTAVENVATPLELDGVATRAALAEARTALESLGLADRMDHFPDDLSGGERQRVAIARAVVGPRQLLLADEPSGALDSVTGERVMQQLRDIADRGVAVVMVTHDAQLAAWADRITFLRDGQVVDQTRPNGPDVLLDPGR